MRNSTMWPAGCHTSSKRFTTNGVCTQRWAINHLTISKHNSLGKRLSFLISLGPARGVHSNFASKIDNHLAALPRQAPSVKSWCEPHFIQENGDVILWHRPSFKQLFRRHQR